MFILGTTISKLTVGSKMHGYSQITRQSKIQQKLNTRN